MSFLDWLYSSYPNPHVDGEWGFLHIGVLVLAIAFIVCSSILLKNKKNCSFCDGWNYTIIWNYTSSGWFDKNN